ncbi:MAG: methyltransferase domain-containing protein [Planctomycetota bacterium]|jgi:SAM-dependent methyltransferase
MDELLALLACPETGCSELTFEGDPDGEGVIRTSEGRAYPVIGGVPRMLPADLLKPFLEHREPTFTTRWPDVGAWIADAAEPDPAVLRTLLAYSYAHDSLTDGEVHAERWREALQNYLDGVPLSSFANDVVLDVGCGSGGQSWAMAPNARLVVGLDLSTGFETVLRFERHPNRFYVQGDLMRPPFRPGAFDAIYSHGVLHHTPDPRASFDAVAPLCRAGGRIMVWVYGLDEMRWSYRMSHMAWLRPLTKNLPRPAKLAISGVVTTALEAYLWLPERALETVGLGSVASRLPYYDTRNQAMKEKFRRIFDRFNPPVTFYITRQELERWVEGRGEAEIRSANGRGWLMRLRVA